MWHYTAWKVIRGGVPIHGAKRAHSDAGVAGDSGAEHPAERLGVHECGGWHGKSTQLSASQTGKVAEFPACRGVGGGFSWRPHSTPPPLPCSSDVTTCPHGNITLLLLDECLECSYSCLCFCLLFLNTYLHHSCSSLLALVPFRQKDAQEPCLVMAGRRHSCVAMDLTKSFCLGQQCPPPGPKEGTGWWRERAEPTPPNGRNRVDQARVSHLGSNIRSMGSEDLSTVPGSCQSEKCHLFGQWRRWDGPNRKCNLP